MKKKYIGACLLVLGVFLLTGCGNDNVEIEDGVNPETGVRHNIPDTTERLLECTRHAIGEGDFTLTTEFRIYYVGSFITRMITTRILETEDSERLARERLHYENLFSVYENLAYHDTTVSQRGNTVTFETIIDYSNIDTDHLLAIEGADNNIIQNGRAVLADWRELARRAGISCN